MKKIILSLVFCSFLFSFEGTSQMYNSAMGIRISQNIDDAPGIQWSGKIYVSNRGALSGFLGFMSREPNTAAGASLGYHHHFPLLDIDNFYGFFGAGSRVFLGDIKGTGFGPILGITKLFGQKWNIELDVFPAYLIGARDNKTDERIPYDVQVGLTIRYASK